MEGAEGNDLSLALLIIEVASYLNQENLIVSIVIKFEQYENCVVSLSDPSLHIHACLLQCSHFES